MDERARMSAAITARALAMPEYRAARTVLGYLNFGSEYASEFWVEQALADGKRVLLPKVDPARKELDLYLVDDLKTQTGQGLWGIREPLPERCQRLCDVNEVEFVLLPGVAYTRSGARLGYGGGYYDKLLARIASRPVRVAAAFALQVVQEIPQQSTDIRVEWVVTDQEIIACSQ